MIKSIAFDFDGVILESVDVKDEAIYRLFEDADERERELILKTHRESPGINRTERMTSLSRVINRDSSQEHIEKLVSRFAELVRVGIEECEEVAGVREFLSMLRHMPCYVVSAAPEHEVKEAARTHGFDEFFEDIFGAPRRKSEILHSLLQRERIPAESVLFIGDKISDWETAKQVGVHFVGRVSSGNIQQFPSGITTINDFTSGQELLDYIRGN